jgi:hypothetical protein
MIETAEQEMAPDTTEATINYLLDTGATPFTYTGGPASWRSRRHPLTCEAPR